MYSRLYVTILIVTFSVEPADLYADHGDKHNQDKLGYYDGGGPEILAYRERLPGISMDPYSYVSIAFPRNTVFRQAEWACNCSIVRLLIVYCSTYDEQVGALSG